jgi:hypothetical protein
MLLRRVAFPDFCEPCLPSPADKPPAGSGWLHEIKHDGFRMLVRRNAGGVRLFTRNGRLDRPKRAAGESRNVGNGPAEVQREPRHGGRTCAGTSLCY